MSESEYDPDPDPETGARDSMPLYVDLDGTLIASDMLWETLWRLLCRQPLFVVMLPIWLLGGRSALKEAIASRVTFRADLLPYRASVLRYLEAQKDKGRRVVLATASSHRIAAPIADHLGLFDHFVGSDANRNLRSGEKLGAIRDDCDGAPFEYIGDSRADLPVWAGAAVATMVAPGAGIRSQVEALPAQTRIIDVEPTDSYPAIRAMRAYQWVKNGLLFVPILLAHEVSDVRRLFSVVLALACFCVVASATYMLNDLLDIESDRQHPRKRMRPFASGALSIPRGLLVMSLLVAGGFGTSLLILPAASTAMLALYTVLTVSYSFYIKEHLFVDVLMLAGLYTHRVLSGAVAGDVIVSPWLLAFSLFFFLSLALLKRFAELLAAQDKESESLSRRAYRVDDITMVETMGVSSGYLSVLVLCLFISSSGVSVLYPTPELLWLVCPIFLYWISRMWFLARRRILADDPVLFAATDRGSYLTGALIVLVGIASSWPS